MATTHPFNVSHTAPHLWRGVGSHIRGLQLLSETPKCKDKIFRWRLLASERVVSPVTPLAQGKCPSGGVGQQRRPKILLVLSFLGLPFHLTNYLLMGCHQMTSQCSRLWLWCLLPPGSHVQVRKLFKTVFLLLAFWFLSLWWGVTGLQRWDLGLVWNKTATSSVAGLLLPPLCFAKLQ